MSDDQNLRQLAADHFDIDDHEEDTLDPVDAADMQYLADSTGPDVIDFMSEDEAPAEPEAPVDHEAPVAPEDPVEPVAPVEPTETVAELKARLEMEEKRRRDLQSWNDKRYSELQEQIKQAQQQPQQPEPLNQGLGREDIKNAVEQNPVHAFQWTIQNQPDRISEVISTIREVHGNELADEAQVAYSQVQAMYVQQQYQQAMQEQAAAQQEAAAPEIIRRGMEQIVEEIASEDAEGFKQVAPRVMELVQQNWDNFTERGDVSPYSVRDFIQRQVLSAYREETRRQATTPRPPQAIPATEQVEGGTPGAAPVTDRSSEDEIADDIVAAYNRSRYQ